MFAIKNLMSNEVEVFDPETAPSEPSRAATKDAYREWSLDPRTEDAFISCVVGMNPAVRVSKDNPAVRMTGVVFDYDTPMPPERREEVLKRMGRKPSYISETYSGGTRTVYLFEEPIRLVENADFIRALLGTIRKQLRPGNRFGVPDNNAFEQISHYYHRGWGFREAGGEPIPAEVTYAWEEAAWKAINWHREGLDLPLKKVEAEIRRRWPDALGGEPLCEGLRCRRFWDASADNPTAAQCVKGGFRCYTGNEPFVSWERLLGAEFCTTVKFEGERRALDEIYCIGDRFWFRPSLSPGEGATCKDWTCKNRQNTETLLATRYGLATGVNPETGLSQVKEVIGKIIDRKSLQGYLPFLYGKDEVVVQDGSAYLNISIVQALTPATEGGEAWGDKFEWIAEFLLRLFGEEPLPYFLSWLARTYQGALQHDPKRGQALFIAGPSGVGKSFLSERILAPLLGGRAEATEYLMGKTQFNKNVFKYGLLFVDDAQPLADRRAHGLFSAIIKQLSANDEFTYTAKYQDSVKISWLGRVVVTLNDDPESLGMLPDVTISNKDKLMFFRVQGKEMEEKDPGAKVEKELPYFARYLSKYETPEECRGTPRYGVKCWLESELYAESQARGAGETFREVFMLFLDIYFQFRKGESKVRLEGPSELRGSATEIFQLMKLQEGVSKVLEGLVKEGNIGVHLGKLKSLGTFPINQFRKSTRRVWVVKREEYKRYREEGAGEEEEEERP